MGVQMELGLKLDTAKENEIDIKILNRQVSDLRKSFFARMNAMERVVEEVRLENEGLKDEIERLKTEMCCI